MRDDQQDQLQRIHASKGGASGASGGAHMNGSGGSDKRITRAIDWVLAAIGSAVLLLMWRAGDTLVDLKVNVATLTERVNSKDARDDQQDRRIEQLEGHTFRGVAGFDESEQESKRGH